jgi:microcompartment protein CcmL/EutN
MNRKKPLCIIEIQNFANSLLLLDRISKYTELELIDYQHRLGGRLITLILSGEVSALQEVVDISKKMYEGTFYLKVADVVPNPSDELYNFITKGV